MKMKKTALLIAGVMVLSLGLTACGGSSSGSSSSAPASEASQAASQEAPSAEPGDYPSSDASSGSSGQASAASTELDPVSGLPTNAYFTVNGTKVAPGMKLADVKDSLGKEIQPSETIQPCDPTMENPTVEYYYNGIQITTSQEDVITMVDVRIPEEGTCEALFAGEIKLGDPVDSIKECLGEGDDDDEVALTYHPGDNSIIMVYKDDEGNNTISGIILASYDLE